MTNIMKISDKKYPKLLKKIPDAPQEFYYRGEWDAKLFDKCLAVVGSRRITSYGRQAVRLLVEDCARAGVTIVSGFMYGVDAAAHRAALDAGGKTIAVMPCGIEAICPEYQADLHKEIIDTGGLVISEYSGDAFPFLTNFPARNRIVAGLSKATLVIEAAPKSGSLITARLAKKYKRHLLAVPGPITSTVSQGTLGLISGGAIMVVSSADILPLYGLSLRPVCKTGEEFKGLEKKIIEQLQAEGLRVDDIAYALKLSVAKVGAVLSLMALKGSISEDCGKFILNIKR
jgi:DNA processing protein